MSEVQIPTLLMRLHTNKERVHNLHTHTHILTLINTPKHKQLIHEHNFSHNLVVNELHHHSFF